MEKFNVDEFLRYLSTGIFFTCLNFFLILDKNGINGDQSYIKEKILILGDSMGTALIGMSLVSGTTIYILYRAFFYPIIINPLAVLLTNRKRKKDIPAFVEKSIPKIISETDKKRWEITDESLKKKLSEWASQIHYLYNLTICCFLVFSIHSIVPDFYHKNTGVLLVIGVIFLFISLCHHYRYKRFEIEFIKERK